MHLALVNVTRVGSAPGWRPYVGRSLQLPLEVRSPVYTIAVKFESCPGLSTLILLLGSSVEDTET